MYLGGGRHWQPWTVMSKIGKDREFNAQASRRSIASWALIHSLLKDLSLRPIWLVKNRIAWWPSQSTACYGGGLKLLHFKCPSIWIVPEISTRSSGYRTLHLQVAVTLSMLHSTFDFTPRIQIAIPFKAPFLLRNLLLRCVRLARRRVSRRLETN